VVNRSARAGSTRAMKSWAPRRPARISDRVASAQLRQNQRVLVAIVARDQVARPQLRRHQRGVENRELELMESREPLDVTLRELDEHRSVLDGELDRIRRTLADAEAGIIAEMQEERGARDAIAARIDERIGIAMAAYCLQRVAQPERRMAVIDDQRGAPMADNALRKMLDRTFIAPFEPRPAWLPAPW